MGRQIEHPEQALRKQRLGGRSARIRSAVFDAAVQLLQEHGYEAATIAAIARQAAVNETSLYRRWGTREALLTEALLARVEQAIHMPDTGSLRSDLVQLLQEAIAFVHSPLGSTLVQLSLTAPLSPSFTQARQRYWRERFALLTVLFERATARGERFAALDPQLVLETLIGPIYLRLLLTGEPLEEPVIEQTVDLVLAGIHVR
jgi:AcrR family transcriptional regulator